MILQLSRADLYELGEPHITRTFLAVFPLESRSALTSISLECKTGLTSCLILALLQFLSTCVLNDKKTVKKISISCFQDSNKTSTERTANTAKAYSDKSKANSSVVDENILSYFK